MYCTRLALLCLSAAVLAAASGPPAQSGCPHGALPAYAHNDYSTPRPLHGALALGYQGAEVDVFLVDGVLRLGHDRGAAEQGARLEVQYLEPLRDIVAECGTLTADGRPFLLTVDIKEKSRPTFDSVVALLGRYAELFTDTGRASIERGPAVEAVLVGWYPQRLAQAGPFPIPLGRQQQLRHNDVRSIKTLDADVRLIGVDYRKTMGRWWTTPGARRHWLSTIRAVKAAHPNIPLRVYHSPVDEEAYKKLLDANVDLIGTQNLITTAQLLGALRATREP